MFTGIVTDIGTIDAVESRGDTRVRISTAYDMGSVDLGASIACSGVCLTVVDKSAPGAPGWFAVDVSGETISRTAGAQWSAGRHLNLERAMKLGDELGGHIVTGHVDGVGTVVSVAEEGGSHRVFVRVPAELAPFVATKGSVTIDGVSLTVNSVEDGQDGTVVGLNIIPHTAAVTTLGTVVEGQGVNVEIDVLARYLQRMEHYRGR
ncbi:riboflavin synthase [uncultured Sphingomonas sp.]|uniref:riboflavin synthase n=1 Tax=uncultured Sphingomonas sp. TaxID=158754 RepID=UPI002617363D|nr:riboflavin synthase [uncultured Sphingomonas sp.]